MKTLFKKARDFVISFYWKFRIHLGLKKNWTVWKRIQIGNHKTIQSLKNAIYLNGCEIETSAGTILATMPLRTSIDSLDLVLVTPAELGISKPSTYQDIIRAGCERGLKLNPAEAAIQLRLQYTDQQVGQRLHMAMDAIDIYRVPLILTLEHFAPTGNWYDGACLLTSSVDAQRQPIHYFSKTDLFIFAKL